MVSGFKYFQNKPVCSSLKYILLLFTNRNAFTGVTLSALNTRTTGALLRAGRGGRDHTFGDICVFDNTRRGFKKKKWLGMLFGGLEY